MSNQSQRGSIFTPKTPSKSRRATAKAKLKTSEVIHELQPIEMSDRFLSPAQKNPISSQHQIRAEDFMFDRRVRKLSRELDEDKEILAPLLKAFEEKRASRKNSIADVPEESQSEIEELPIARQIKILIEKMKATQDPLLSPDKIEIPPEKPVEEEQKTPEKKVNSFADPLLFTDTQVGGKQESVKTIPEEAPPPPEEPPPPRYSKELTAHEDRFEYLLRIEADTSDKWELRIDKPDSKIWLSTGSELNETVPMVRAILNFTTFATPNDLYNILYDVEFRKQWDKASVVDYEEFDRPSADVVLYYMHNKAPWPFQDRDFVEKRCIKRLPNNDIEIVSFHITDERYPPKAKMERGETIVGGQIFRSILLESGTCGLQVILVSQADMKTKIPPKMIQDTLPMQMVKWQKTVEKVLENYMAQKNK